MHARCSSLKIFSQKKEAVWALYGMKYTSKDDVDPLVQAVHATYAGLLLTFSLESALSVLPGENTAVSALEKHGMCKF